MRECYTHFIMRIRTIPLLAVVCLWFPLVGDAAEPANSATPHPALITDARLAFPPPMTTLGQVRQVMAANGGQPAVQAQVPPRHAQPVLRKDRDWGIALWSLFALGVLLSNGVAAVLAFRKWRKKMRLGRALVVWTLALALTWLLASNPGRPPHSQRIVLLAPTLVRTQHAPADAVKVPLTKEPPATHQPVATAPAPVLSKDPLPSAAPVIASVAPTASSPAQLPAEPSVDQSPGVLALTQPELPAATEAPVPTPEAPALSIALMPSGPPVAPTAPASPVAPTTSTPAWVLTTGLLLKIEVNADGWVTQVVVARSGGDPLRDAVLVMELKKKQLKLNPPLAAGQTAWFDYALDYGGSPDAALVP